MSYPCPKGHQSAEPDYCDTCGAAIAGAAPQPSTGEQPAAGEQPMPAGQPGVGAGEPCPVCATPRVGADRFCENDGYDFVSGRRPEPDPARTAAPPSPMPLLPTGVAPAAAPVAGSWTATVEADRSYFDRVSVEGVDFPAVCPPRTFVLVDEQVRIGRRSVSKGVAPEIDLSGPPLDPGISHLHLVLSRDSQLGGWLLTDPGSTNGASLNEASELLEQQTRVALADGDRIHLGAWTTITVRAPAAP